LQIFVSNKTSSDDVDQNIIITEQAMVLISMLSMPPIFGATFAELTASLLQALMQIQEQILSFAIKSFCTVLVLTLSAYWIGVSDVTSVFTVVGSCEKMSFDVIRWIGLSKFPLGLRRMQLEAGVNSPDLSRDAIIRSCDSVCISSLSEL
jgi:type III secretion protein S